MTVAAARRKRINNAIGYMALVPPPDAPGAPLNIPVFFNFESHIRKAFRVWRRCMLFRALVVRDPADYYRELEKHPNIGSPGFLEDWAAAKRSVDDGTDLFADLR
jgi:hypothetical protein